MKNIFLLLILALSICSAGAQNFGVSKAITIAGNKDTFLVVETVKLQIGARTTGQLHLSAMNHSKTLLVTKVNPILHPLLIPIFFEALVIQQL